MTTNDEKITMSDYQIQEINTPHIVCRSNYKMTCHCCNQPIYRGDLITKCEESKGMRLRPVRFENGAFYTPFTNERWVHLHCDPGCWTGWTAYITP